MQVDMFNRKEFIKQGYHWIGEKPLPNVSFGFLYVIVNILDKKLYIGKKQYKGRRNRKNGTYYEVNNKWEFYTSSSKYVNEDIEKVGIENFIFIILKNYVDDVILAKAEEDLQKELDVLKLKVGEEYLFYNKNINGKLFRPIEKHKTKKVQPLDNYVGGNNPNFGKKHSTEARKLMSEASKNRIYKPETTQKRVETMNKNRKVYKFYHADGNIHIGTREDLVEKYPNTKLGVIKELILGRTWDKTCLLGYSKVHSRYGWIKAEIVGLNKDIDKLIKEYG